MAIGADFESVSALRCKNKALAHRTKELESGGAYAKLAEEKRLSEKRLGARIKSLEAEIGSQRRLAVKMRKCWFEVFEQVERERDEAVGYAMASVRRMQERAFRAERKVDELKDLLVADARRIRELQAEMEALECANAKLTAQVNKDFENSSLPSSAQGPRRKKIPNTRKATGRKPGAQPGHPHHPRRRPTPTRSIMLEDAEGFADDPDLYKTKECVSKIVVSAQVSVEAIEYTASVWRRHSNGARVHTPFPGGATNEVTYDGSVKALAFLLTNECCASAAKAKAFLREASGGALDLSVGMICALGQEFSSKSEPERAQAISLLMASPIMHADFTGANVGGAGKQVLILANRDACTMLARDNKGHKGIEGSPLEGYVGCSVHDHDITFYSYGATHQECMQHNIRHLVGSTQNETGLAWNNNMLALLRETISWHNSLPHDLQPDPSVVAAFERRYDEIIEQAAREYENSPPSKYYREGYNLYKRLRDFKDSELRFLHDRNVPPDNSLCERLARVFKRKQRQAIVFRSFNSLGYTCEAIATINNMRNADKNVFAEVVDIFNRTKPSKPHPDNLLSPG